MTNSPMAVIRLPLYVDLPRVRTADKRFILNLNNYRNAHYHILNDAKVRYKDAVAMSCSGITILPGPYLFAYRLFPGDRRLCDIANVLPIVQKFTDDALITLGLIPDDNYKVIREVRYALGGVDRDNPRAELEVYGTEL